VQTAHKSPPQASPVFKTGEAWAIQKLCQPMQYQTNRALKPTEARIFLPFDRFDRLTDRPRARLFRRSDDY